MKTKTLIVIAICVALFNSCNKMKSKEFVTNDVSYMMMSSISKNSTPPPPPAQTGQYNPKLIKKGNMTISSSDIESTKKLIYDFLTRCNGYVVNENLEKTETESYYQINLNIQAGNFDRFVQLIDSAHLTIVSRSFSVEDVTLEYIDDSTRLANKKKLEKRYLEILAKAQDIKEMLQIEEKLEEIRTDAEVREAQLKLMEKQIAYSEFNLKIEKSINYVSSVQKDKYTYKVAEGIGKGWEGIKNSFVFLISIWPVYLLLGVVYFLVKYFLKRMRMNRVKNVH